MQLQKDALLNGRYRLLEKKGSGGFSVVWLAVDEKLGNARVAIKIYAPDKGLDTLGVQQFEEEFKLTGSLNDSRLLRITDYFTEDDSPCLVMPFCERGTLYDKLRREGPMGEAEIAKVLYQAAGGLKYLHSQPQPIIHSDIKPDNILVSYSGDYVLADFGISSTMRSTLIRASNMKGETLAYSTPERCLNKPINTQADIFALGITLYELATGRVPYEDGGRSLVLGLPMPEVPEQFTQRFAQLIHACLAINPEHRPTAAQLEQLGRNYLDNGYWDEISFGPGDEDIAEEVQNRRTTPMQRTPVSANNPAAEHSPIVSGGVMHGAEGPMNEGKFVRGVTRNDADGVAGGTKKRSPALAIIVVIILLAGGAGAYFAFMRPGDPNAGAGNLAEAKDTATHVVETPTTAKEDTSTKVITPASNALTEKKEEPAVKKNAPPAAEKKPAANAVTQTLSAHNGNKWVKISGKWGMNNSAGDLVISPTYDEAVLSNEGTWLKKGGKWGFADKSGRLVTPTTNDAYREFSESLAAIQFKGKWGYINTKGKIVIVPKYENARDFRNGKAPVLKNGKTITIDTNGDCLSNCD